MVNRLFKIAVFTGAAHIFTIFTLKFLSQRVPAEDISLLGEIDSLFQLIINKKKVILPILKIQLTKLIKEGLK